MEEKPFAAEVFSTMRNDLEVAKEQIERLNMARDSAMREKEEAIWEKGILADRLEKSSALIEERQMQIAELNRECEFYVRVYRVIFMFPQQHSAIAPFAHIVARGDIKNRALNTFKIRLGPCYYLDGYVATQA
jgi:hypothetical protein